MARRMTPESEAPVDASNAKAIIAAAAKKLLQLDAQIAELQEKKKQARAPLKGLVKMADFAAAFRLYKLEGSERLEALDGFRLAYEALEIGQQASLFPEAADPMPEPPKKGAAKNAMIVANQAGAKAGAGGKSADQNPYAAGSENHASWMRGWQDGQAELAAQLGRPSGNGGQQPAAA